MQDVSAELGATLQLRSTSTSAQRGNRLLAFEVYASDYYPNEDAPFDPTVALARWSTETFSWVGLSYTRRVLEHDDVSRFFSSQFNDTSFTLANNDLGASTFILQNKVAGMRLVVRYINLDITQLLSNSLVLFVGELQRPDELDEQECKLSAKQLLGSVTYEVPQRTFSPQDPNGRSQADALYEGFWFNPIRGAFTYITTVTKRFLLFFTKKKNELHSQQWSSEQGTDQNQVVPLIFGRCSMELIPALWADVGFFIAGLFVAAGHKVSAITNVKVQTDGYIQQAGQPDTAHTHLGDLGGTGTNAAADTVFNLLPGNTALLSRTAYVGMAIFGPESPTASSPNPGEDAVPTVTGIILGEHDLPDGSNQFTLKGPTSNPSYITRFFLTSPDCLNMDGRLIHSGECVATAKECDTIIRDDTGGEMLTLAPNLIGSMQDGEFQRFTSAGVVDTRLVKYQLGLGPNPLVTARTSGLPIIADGDGICPIGTHRDPVSGDCVPNGGDGCPVGFHRDPETGICVLNDPYPWQLVPLTYFRRRYQFNAPLTDRAKAVDFLFNTIMPSARLYMVTGADGRLRIRTEKPADSTRLTLSASAGSGSIFCWNVDPWRASLKGYVLIGVGQTTSEVRKVTAANYSSSFDSIPISASASGGMGLTASGSTLSGGGPSTPSSGSFTVSGAPAAGAQIVARINGVDVGYTLNAGDTLKSAAYMLAVAINAEWRLRQYMAASWDGNVGVNVHCTAGSLTLDANLTNSHAIQISPPSSAPVLTAVGGGTLAPGTYYFARSYQTGSGGETFISPVSSIVISAGQKVNIGSEVLPGGVSGLKWYMSKAPNDPTLAYLTTTFGAAFTVNVLPDPDADIAPIDNTSGEEVIRVMASFTEKNILKGKFRWPLASKGSTTNQIYIQYREAASGFAERKLYVNDFEDQRRTKTVNKMEIDGSGIDNFNQANRIANSRLSKERDGDFFAEWDTDEAGMIFEEGDVVCCSDYSGGFVNLPMRIEELHIHNDLSVTFLGRIYSTAMLTDGAGKAPVVVSTTLKFFTNPPGVATNLVLTEVGGYSPDLSFITGIRGDFDFAQFVGLQQARIYIKGPATDSAYTEPADSTYRLIDNALPDSNAHGQFDVRSLARGKYWIKVVTESTITGRSEASGHPVASLVLSPPQNTLIKIIDSVAPFDNDVDIFGLTIGVAHQAGAGVWHGMLLFRDRGYGYEKIATIDREALLGHTVAPYLSASGDDVYFFPESENPTFVNATLADVQSGKNNYFFGQERVGVRTWTNIGGGVWHGSSLVRGMGGSEVFQSTHTANESAVQIDSNIAFVQLDITDVLKPLNFKAVTFGQDISAVGAIAFTPTGESIKGLLPIDVEAARLLNDWAFSFDGRSRRSNAEYALDIVNVGTGALIRSLPVQTNMRQAMYLIDFNPSYDTVQRSTNYGIRFQPSFDIFADPPIIIGHARSLQTLAGFSYEVEAVFEEYDVTFTGAMLGLILDSTPLSFDPTNGNETTPIPFAIQAVPAGGFQSAIQAVENGTVMASMTISSPGSGQLSKLAKIAVFGTEVHYIYDGTIFYKSKKLPTGPYRAFISAGIAADSSGSDVVSHLKMGVGDETYSTVYSERQQQNDFGSAQASVRVQIYEVQNIAGVRKGQIYDKVFP